MLLFLISDARYVFCQDDTDTIEFLLFKTYHQNIYFVYIHLWFVYTWKLEKLDWTNLF